eukprot:gene9030-8158_t
MISLGSTGPAQHSKFDLANPTAPTPIDEGIAHRNSPSVAPATAEKSESVEIELGYASNEDHDFQEALVDSLYAERPNPVGKTDTTVHNPLPSPFDSAKSASPSIPAPSSGAQAQPAPV